MGNFCWLHSRQNIINESISIDKTPCALAGSLFGFHKRFEVIIT
nr:MAG TPA: hypothetical protein [Caudoviricetes sp.]